MCAFVHLKNLFLFHRCCCKEIASFFSNAQKKTQRSKQMWREITENERSTSKIPRSVLDIFKVSISFVSLKQHFGWSVIQSTMTTTTTKMIKANEDLFILISSLFFLLFSLAVCLFCERARNGQDNQYANDHQNANYLTFTSWSQNFLELVGAEGTHYWFFFLCLWSGFIHNHSKIICCKKSRIEKKFWNK